MWRYLFFKDKTCILAFTKTLLSQDFLEMIAHVVLFCNHNFDHCAGTRTIIECKKDVPKDILYLSISFSPKMSKSFFIMFSWVLLRVIVSKSFLEMQEKTIIRPFYSLMDSFIFYLYIYGIEFFVLIRLIIDKTPTSLRVLVHSNLSEDIAEICNDLFHKIEIYFKEKFLLICWKM